jgi:hypothetical protein
MGLLAALLASATIAQSSVTASANVSWVAPTLDVNGNLLAGSTNVVTSYNVYASTTPLTAVPATPLATVTAPTTTVSGSAAATVGSTLYVYVTACNATGCSALSVAGTRLITAPGAAPGVPTNVVVTVTIT